VSLTCLSGPTIPAGSALSEGIDVSAGRIINLIMPSQWSGGACLSFLVSTDDTIFNNRHLYAF
jgi:hypothetical protein